MSTFLTENGYISDGKITDTGFAALEPYRVKRAIFIAAGFGSRLVPITLNTPKPLVRVHNVLSAPLCTDSQGQPSAMADRIKLIFCKHMYTSITYLQRKYEFLRLSKHEY